MNLSNFDSKTKYASAHSAEEIAKALNGKPSGSGWQCHCPAHDDKSPSLSVAAGSDGKVLYKCHAGCAQEAVTNALRTRGLLGAGKSQAQKRIEYIYDDLAGQPALKVTRTHLPGGLKKFSQSRMESGEWRYGGAKAEVTPYKFSKWKDEAERLLFLVEGEKCADALIQRGFLATTTPGGSKNWRAHYAKHFAGRNVVILPDNDNPGFQYAADAYRDIKPLAKSLRVIELQDLAEGGDVFDFFAQGRTADELKTLIKDSVGHSQRFELALGGAKEIRQPASPSNECTGVIDDQEWQDPGVLQGAAESLPRVEHSDIQKILPVSMSNYVLDVSSRLGVGPEFVSIPLFSILGGIVGRRVGVRPKRNDTWTVFPCCEWGCIAAPPGSKKSPILNEVRKFADKLEDEALEIYVGQKRNADSKLQSLAQRKKVIEKNLLKAHEDNDNDQALRLEIELTMLAQDVEKVTPKQMRYLTSDSTSAKLTEIMADNPGGIIVFRDELDGLIQSFEQMGNESLRAFYIEAWDGKGRITQDRVSVGTRRARGVAATLLGSTQPDKLARIVSSSDDGLIQRFGCLVCMFDQNIEECDRAPDINAFERLCQFCQAASKLDGENPLELTFSEEARTLFKEWSKSNSAIMKDPATPSPMRSHLAKYPAVFCGLSCLFETVSIFERTGSVQASEVSASSAEMAAEWIDSILLPHARFVYGKNMAQTAAEKLSIRILAGHVTDGITVRAIERKNWEGLSNSTLVRYALEELTEAGWLRIERIQPGLGRPTEKIRLNPRLNKGAE